MSKLSNDSTLTFGIDLHHLREERHPLLDREERVPRGVHADGDDDVAEERGGALDEVEVAERDRVEAAGVDGETRDGGAGHGFAPGS